MSSHNVWYDVIRCLVISSLDPSPSFKEHYNFSSLIFRKSIFHWWNYSAKWLETQTWLHEIPPFFSDFTSNSLILRKTNNIDVDHVVKWTQNLTPLREFKESSLEFVKRERRSLLLHVYKVKQTKEKKSKHGGWNEGFLVESSWMTGSMLLQGHWLRTMGLNIKESVLPPQL